MKKHDRKTENKIVKALNNTCNELMSDSVGFCWLTHFVDYADVSKSLRMVCVFDTNLSLVKAQREGLAQAIPSTVERYLKKEGILVFNVESAVYLDTEENGADVNSPGWCRKYSSS